MDSMITKKSIARQTDVVKAEKSIASVAIYKTRKFIGTMVED